MIMHPILAALLFTPSGQQGGGFSVFIIQIGLFIAIFYFLLIRPQREQQKKHKALLESLQKGDKIVTSGGMVGEVIHIKDNEVTVKSGESRLVIVRSSVQSITNRTAGEVKEAPKELPKETKPA
jgi:preprotein translocase subunit YajC